MKTAFFGLAVVASTLALTVSGCLPTDPSHHPLDPSTPTGLLLGQVLSVSGTGTGIGLGTGGSAPLSGCATANQTVSTLPFSEGSGHTLSFMQTYRYKLLVPAGRTLNYTVTPTPSGVDYDITWYDGTCSSMGRQWGLTTSYSGTLAVAAYAYYTVEIENGQVPTAPVTVMLSAY